MKLGKKKNSADFKIQCTLKKTLASSYKNFRTVIKDLASHVLFLVYPSTQYANSNLLAQNPSKE